MSMYFEPVEPMALTWQDGVPYSSRFNDIYFSTEHGLDEAQHVFIEGNHLQHRWQTWSRETSDIFVIGETGFGTGLNVLLACKLFKKIAPKSARLHIFSVEKYPLSRDDLALCLSLWPDLEQEACALLANYPVALTPGFHTCFLDERIQLTLMLGDVLASFESLLVCGESALETALRPWHVDAWFLDGFAPAKNPDMWDERLLVTLSLLSHHGTTCATFSAAGMVRRGLQAAGFEVAKQPGFGKKREMTVGHFVKKPECTSFKQHTPWHIGVRQNHDEKHAIILGAGLAGCFTAFALRKRGWRVTLIDTASDVGQGASGNRQAVLFPNLSAYRSPLTSWMLQAFLFALHVYKPLVAHQHVPGQLNGMLQLVNQPRVQRGMASLRTWLKHYPELGRWVNAEEASALAGVDVHVPGLFVPHAGWLDGYRLCQFLSQDEGIKCVFNADISVLKEGKHWYVGDHHAPVLVVATGYQAGLFSETEALPLKAFRGQMTSVKSGTQGHKLRVPLCAEGHLLPAYEDSHWLGATYQPGVCHGVEETQDDVENVQKILALSLESVITEHVVGHWAGVRGATPDYLPFVGPVASSTEFLQQFAALRSHARRFIPAAGVYQSGLYVCAGFGSRGLTTIPLSAHYLASCITQEPCDLPRAMVQSLSPARLLRRSLVRHP